LLVCGAAIKTYFPAAGGFPSIRQPNAPSITLEIQHISVLITGVSKIVRRMDDTCCA
jgi:hypothetical protein